MIQKHLLAVAIAAGFLSGAGSANAQGLAVNTTGSAANSSAIMDVSSTTQGMLIPRMTSAQRTAISSPATGLLVYQTDGTPGFYFYNGSAWVSLSGSASGTAGGDLTGSYPNPTIAATSGAGADVVSAINASFSVVNAGNLGTGSSITTKYLRGDNTWQTVSSGSGTVTSVSSGFLAPLFITSVSNATTTPNISYTLASSGAHTFFGNFTSGITTPSYSTPTLASGDFANQGATTTVLHGNAAGNPSWGSVSLSSDVSGTLPASNGGTGNSSYTVGDILYASSSTALSKLNASTSGKVLTSNGVGVAPTWQTPSGGGISTWTAVSTSQGLAVNTNYVVTAGGITLTLPSSPATGSVIGVASHATWTLNTNGKHIWDLNTSAGDWGVGPFTCDGASFFWSFILVYDGTEWDLVSP